MQTENNIEFICPADYCVFKKNLISQNNCKEDFFIGIFDDKILELGFPAQGLKYNVYIKASKVF